MRVFSIRVAWTNGERLITARHLLQDLLLVTTALLGPVSVLATERIESVVVTATRQPSSTLSLSSSMALVEREDIEMVAPVHISEVLSRTAGTWISRGNGQEHLTAMRSPVFTGPGSCGSFYMAEDGVPLRPAGFCNVNQLFEVDAAQAERIEVLRGPGTAVHGGSALHGVINVISQAPAAAPEGRVALEGGPHDYARLRGSYSGRAGQQGWRLNINAAHDGGYKDDAGFEDYRLSWRHDVAAEDWSLKSLLSAAKLQQETAGYVEGERSYRDNHLRRFNPNPEAFRDNLALRWQGQFTLPVSDGRRWVVTPFVRYQDMRFLQHFLPGQPSEENGAVSAGWQSAHYWERDGWSAAAGIDGEWAQGYLEEYQPQPVAFPAGLPQGQHYDYEVDSINTAAFASASRVVTPSLRLNAGVRLEHQHYDYDNRMLAGATDDSGAPCRGGSGGVIPCRYTRPADRDDTFLDHSLEVGAVWQLAPGHALSARLARGFRPPQTAELYRLQAGQEVTDLDSERADSIEAGWRGGWPALEAELTLYLMDKADVIFQDSQRRNVVGADSEHYGAEYRLHWEFMPQWHVATSGSWARHRFTRDVALSGLGAGERIEGNDMVAAPRTLVSSRLGWDGGHFGIWEIEWLHIGRYYLEATNRHSYPGHDLLNLRWRRQLTPELHVAARLLNVSDRDYAERADFAFGNYRYFVGEPRSLYLELGWRFD